MSEDTRTPASESDEAPTVPVGEPTEPGWYAYSGGRQTMLFHLSEPGRWRVFTDNGSTAECVWDYIEQALSDGCTLDRIPLPVGSLPVESAPAGLNRLICQWGAQSVMDAFAMLLAAHGILWPNGEITPEPARPTLAEGYEIREDNLYIDGRPFPWHISHPTNHTILVEESYPERPGQVHILWIPVQVNAPLPSPPEGHPSAAQVLAAPTMAGLGDPPADDGIVLTMSREVAEDNENPALAEEVTRQLREATEPGDGDRDPHRP